MKKSEIYLKAQLAVLNSNISGLEKLEILRVLISDENVAQYTETQSEQEDKNAETL